MRNLEDPRIKKAVQKAASDARALGFTVPKTTEAAVHAYQEASRHPDSLVRVTSRTNDETERVLFALGDTDHGVDRIDWVKTANSTAAIDDFDLGLAFVVEFKNGSAIELRVGKGCRR